MLEVSSELRSKLNGSPSANTPESVTFRSVIVNGRSFQWASGAVLFSSDVLMASIEIFGGPRLANPTSCCLAYFFLLRSCQGSLSRFSLIFPETVLWKKPQSLVCEGEEPILVPLREFESAAL